MLEEVVRLRDRVVVDRDVALGAELVDELLDRDRGRDFVILAGDDDAAGGAWREEGEVVEVGGWRDRDEAANFGAAHQKLHADPRAEAATGNPGGRGFGIEALTTLEH